MSALQSARKGSSRLVFRDKRPLAANAKVYKGALALAILSSTSKGFYKQAVSGAVGIVVGRFTQSVDNTGGADGDLFAEIDFSFRAPAGRKLYLLDNDTSVAVAKADREGVCYVLDDHTVSMTTATALAGVVYDVTDEGVWIEMGGAAGEESAAGLSDVAPTDPSSTAANAGADGLAARRDHKHHLALAIPAAEGLMSGAYASAISPVAANTTAIKAIAAAARADGMIVQDRSTGHLWRFSAASTAADTAELLVLVPGAGNGRWLLMPGKYALSIPVTYAKADAAVLHTVPVGARLAVDVLWHDVGTTYAGGSSSAVGVSASHSGFSTKGDLLGGSAGDTTLSSLATGMQGTKGDKLPGRLLLEAGDTIIWNRITSAFTSGASTLRVLCDVVANPGA